MIFVTMNITIASFTLILYKSMGGRCFKIFYGRVFENEVSSWKTSFVDLPWSYNLEYLISRVKEAQTLEKSYFQQADHGREFVALKTFKSSPFSIAKFKFEQISKRRELVTLYAIVVHLICSLSNRDSKSGERGEHTRAIFLPLLC